MDDGTVGREPHDRPPTGRFGLMARHRRRSRAAGGRACASEGDGFALPPLADMQAAMLDSARRAREVTLRANAATIGKLLQLVACNAKSTASSNASPAGSSPAKRPRRDMPRFALTQETLAETARGSPQPAITPRPASHAPCGRPESAYLAWAGVDRRPGRPRGAGLRMPSDHPSRDRRPAAARRGATQAGRLR